MGTTPDFFSAKYIRYSFSLTIFTENIRGLPETMPETKAREGRARIDCALRILSYGSYTTDEVFLTILRRGRKTPQASVSCPPSPVFYLISFSSAQNKKRAKGESEQWKKKSFNNVKSRLPASMDDGGNNNDNVNDNPRQTIIGIKNIMLRNLICSALLCHRIRLPFKTGILAMKVP